MQERQPSSDPVTERVMTEVHARLAARSAAMRMQREEKDHRWRMFFVLTLIALIAAIVFVPAPTPERRLILVLSGVCAQQHNLFVGGIQLPLCARDTGMYLSVLATLGVIRLRGRTRAGALPPWHILATLIGLVALMAVDGINSTINEIGMTPWYEPRNDLRTATGMGAGVGLAVALTLLFNRSLRYDVASNLPVLGQWRELGMIALINTAILTAMLLDVRWLAWPLALLDLIGVAGTLFVTAVTAIAAVMNYDGTITRVTQLARPATFALLTTGAFLAGMALLRATMIGG